MMLWDHGHPYIQSTPVLCDMMVQLYNYVRYVNVPYIIIRESVDSLCRDGADARIT